MEHIETVKTEPEAVQETEETFSLDDDSSGKEIQFTFVSCKQEDQEELYKNVKKELELEDCQIAEYPPDDSTISTQDLPLTVSMEKYARMKYNMKARRTASANYTTNHGSITIW
ncbi:uncharacterized protein [Anabrus simplex]|uniref:uncharacterized protein isoform X2 n=1 Tax=Anabrus simplex TaxID=316456 RepID=UPI0035A28915